MNKHTIFFCLVSLGLIPGYLPASEQTKPQADSSFTAILVVAPDRGFMGNEETRDAFDRVNHENKALVFVTDERSKTYLDNAVTDLKKRGARDMTVLPLFISDQRPVWRLAYSWLSNGICNKSFQCNISKPFGQSYFAVDVLEEALLQIPEPEKKNLVLIGYGANDAVTTKRMAEDWQRIFGWTDQGKKFRSVTTLIWATDDDERQSKQLTQLAAKSDTVLLGFHLGPKLDSMMNFDASLRRSIPDGADSHLLTAEIGSDITGLWLQRETNRCLIRGQEDIGVIINAHGSDFIWNQTMRDALASLDSRYKIEYAFSMADRPSIETALTRLQQRGVKGAVIVRVFGRKDSFQDTIEKMVGMDVETEMIQHHGQHAGHDMAVRPVESETTHQGQHTGHDMAGGHGADGHTMMGGRIRTPLVVTSFGGLEDHPLFAEALLDRARHLSREPGKETIILVAHGAGEDSQNAAWMQILERLAEHMRIMGGDQFRAIKFATWREDWPGKREEWIARVRDMVEKARGDNGRAIVIPARTNSVGPEAEFLEGLDYVLGEGFAPNPLFARWVELQIREGITALSANDRDPIEQ